MGFGIELVMSLAILTGIADRLAALILAGYCMLTALLWKQFWKAPDFRLKGQSRGRDVFWDFLKNLALSGGFLLLALGSDASGVRRFWNHPFSSSHPYAAIAPAGGSS
jgi:putative oxidoreductase